MMTSQEIQFLRLYEVDYDPPNTPLRLTNWADDISLDGDVYTAFPIQDSGIKLDSNGRLQPVTVTVGNIDGSRTIQGIIETYDLVGKVVTITRMMNTTNDPIPTAYKISGIVAKKNGVAFTLSVGFDSLASMLPVRKIYKHSCRWIHSDKFKGIECKYAGTDTECEYTYDDCLSKDNVLNFGGFPGILGNHFIF
jgi:phage-related protein